MLSAVTVSQLEWIEWFSKDGVRDSSATKKHRLNINNLFIYQ